MKFLAFVDLHADKQQLKSLLDLANNNDVEFIICAGDVSQFGSGLRMVLEKFNAIKKPFYIIPGNHEDDEMMNTIVKDYPYLHNFHQKVFKIQDYVLLGHGEGGFSKEDPNFRKIARDWYGQYNGQKIIFVTHGTPYGTKVDKVGNNYVGNVDYRSFIERVKPKLVICGHIHETAGKEDMIGETKVVNPGWKGMVLELE